MARRALSTYHYSPASCPRKECGYPLASVAHGSVYTQCSRCDICWTCEAKAYVKDRPSEWAIVFGDPICGKREKVDTGVEPGSYIYTEPCTGIPGACPDHPAK